MSQQPHGPSAARPSPPPGPPPAHLLANRTDDEAADEEPPWQSQVLMKGLRGKASSSSSAVTFNLEEMSRHLHPSDERALNEGMIV